MKQVSFDGVGGVVVTFAAQEGMTDQAQVVKLTDNGEVGPCDEGDAVCGVALSGSDGWAAVQVRGFAPVGITGSVALGWVKLSADGSGGIKTDANGREHLVVDVDGGQAVILL